MFGFKKKTPVAQAEAQPPKLDNAKNEALELCYTDSAGRNFYKWKSPLSMPTMRYFIGWSEIEYANMGVTAKDALEHLTKAMDALSSNQAAQAAYYIGSFRNRIITADPEQAYLKLAACYCLFQHENPKEFSQALAQEKITAWMQDIDAKSFFLTFAFKTSAILTKSLKENTPSVLVNQMQQMTKLLESLTLLKESPRASTS